MHNRISTKVEGTFKMKPNKLKCILFLSTYENSIYLSFNDNLERLILTEKKYCCTYHLVFWYLESSKHAHVCILHVFTIYRVNFILLSKEVFVTNR